MIHVDIGVPYLSSGYVVVQIQQQKTDVMGGHGAHFYPRSYLLSPPT